MKELLLKSIYYLDTYGRKKILRRKQKLRSKILILNKSKIKSWNFLKRKNKYLVIKNPATYLKIVAGVGVTYSDLQIISFMLYDCDPTEGYIK